MKNFKKLALLVTGAVLVSGLLNYFMFDLSLMQTAFSTITFGILTGGVLNSFMKEDDETAVKLEVLEKENEELSFHAQEEERLLRKVERFKRDNEQLTLDLAKKEEEYKKLEHDSKTVELFLASMSHEIRTPLNGIIGWMEILDGGSLTAEQKESVLMIRESSNNLRIIVNDILDVSKMNAGKMELESIRFDFITKMRASVGLFTSQVAEKGINLDVQIDPLIPKFMIGDPTRLSQVVINLVSNAVKFTNKGGDIQVSANMFKETDENITFRVSVSDSGIGLSKEQQHRIFEAYSQATVGTTRESGGTGLGLTISTKIINSMGGKLEVESEEGEGTVFFFVITLKKAEIPKTKNIKQKPTQATPEERTSDLQILVAEDNPINQKLIKIVLEKFGAEVMIAHDGKEAYEKRVNNKYDIIFMDVQMPVLGGVESTKLILKYEKENGLKHVPIVALTANALVGDKERYLAAGMDEYATKPLEVPTLKRIIDKFTAA